MDLPSRLYQRQIRATTTSFTRKSYLNRSSVDKLGLEAELQGHTGCVNCLQWNESGTLLASGSDDQRIVIWNAFGYRQLASFHTGHRNNIFSVQFVPYTNDDLLLTCAGDNTVRLHSMKARDIDRCIHVYDCHTARVKRLAVTAASPHLFWSAGEDGLVLQGDIREHINCKTKCRHCIVNLNHHVGSSTEVKSIAINPCRPELLAVGSNDPIVRIFDIRMLRIVCVAIPDAGAVSGASINSVSLDVDGENYDFADTSAQYYSPGHCPMLFDDYRRRMRQLSVTNLTFDERGTELLVNLGGEHIYLFDVVRNQRTANLLIQLSEFLHKSQQLTSDGDDKNCTTNGHHHPNGCYNFLDNSSIPTSSRSRPLNASAESLKQMGNDHLDRKEYTKAIDAYSRALLIAPDAPLLYANRAAALMRRQWDGDSYAALRDCYATLIRDPNHVKALFRLTRCLHQLKLFKEAKACIAVFQKKFPNETTSTPFKSLENDVNASIRSGDLEWLMTKRDNTEQDHVDRRLRSFAADYNRRFCGHCNTTTDIKEANFFGRNGELIVAGSDDGSFFIWDKSTCEVLRVMKGDESIVNCVQPHPTICLLATSGIETTIRLWSPQPDKSNERVIIDIDRAASANQRQMNADPFEVMLSNIGYHIEPGSADAVQCRPS